MPGTAHSSPNLVCVAAVAAAHGVRGALKLKSFTEEPGNVAGYGALCDAAGHELFRVRAIGPCKGGIIVAAEGITDRDAAEALRGLRLYVPRDRLPATEDDTFYHADLIGLAVVTEAGQEIGRVVAVHDFGAGDVLEFVDAAGASQMVAFTLAHVPAVDLDQRRVVVASAALPAGAEAAA
ncbi:MAG: ribosome maturation factor RimM [Geminicoccaceae bacterium]